MLIMVRKIFLILSLFYGYHCHAEWGEEKSLKERKVYEVERLKERKKAFDIYIKKLSTRDQERESQAFKMKKIRSDYDEFKNKARKQFKRTNYDFPYEAYKKFISQRDKMREETQKSRKDYSQIQKELERIRDNKEYQINGNKEYDL
jgi:hypothetical protein